MALWSYVALMFLARLSQNAIGSLLESCTIKLVLEHGGANIGLQKIYGLVSQSLFSFLAAALVTAMKLMKTEPADGGSYRLSFYAADLMFLCLMLAVGSLDLSADRRAGHAVEWRSVRQLLSSGDVSVFLVVCTLTGVCNYYIDTYFYVFLADLGASDFLMSENIHTIRLNCSIGEPEKKNGATSNN